MNKRKAMYNIIMENNVWVRDVALRTYKYIHCGSYAVTGVSFVPFPSSKLNTGEVSLLLRLSNIFLFKSIHLAYAALHTPVFYLFQCSVLLLFPPLFKYYDLFYYFIKPNNMSKSLGRNSKSFILT